MSNNPATQRPAMPPQEQFRRVQSRLEPSVPINDPHLRYACVTASEAFGRGVFSWHRYEGHAQRNAALTGGWCVPVERDEHGDVVLPEAAGQALVYQSDPAEVLDWDGDLNLYLTLMEGWMRAGFTTAIVAVNGEAPAPVIG